MVVEQRPPSANNKAVSGAGPGNTNNNKASDEMVDSAINDAMDRLKYAHFLNKSMTFPFIPFEQEDDGVYRCVLPKPAKVQLVQLVKPPPTSHHFAKFLAPRKFVSQLEVDLEVSDLTEG